MASIETKDIVIGSDWTKIELTGTVMLVSKIAGSSVLYRFGESSTSVGMPMLDTLKLDRDIFVRATTNTATLAVTR